MNTNTETKAITPVSQDRTVRLKVRKLLKLN